MSEPEESSHQLGFEHGYAGLPHTYPDRPAYVAGHKFGERFRSVVTELAPSLVMEKHGGYSVSFNYVGWMMWKDPMPAMPNPRREGNR